VRLALAIGLFVGIERERRKKGAGVRTFAFAAVLGATGGLLGESFALLAWKQRRGRCVPTSPGWSDPRIAGERARESAAGGTTDPGSRAQPSPGLGASAPSCCSAWTAD
jgi:hypothetical protein